MCDNQDTDTKFSCQRRRRQNDEIDDNNSNAKKFSLFENPVEFLRRRELNIFPRSYFIESETKSSLYRSFSTIGRLPVDCAGVERCGHGGIFGMDFSPDGYFFFFFIFILVIK